MLVKFSVLYFLVDVYRCVRDEHSACLCYNHSGQVLC